MCDVQDAAQQNEEAVHSILATGKNVYPRVMSFFVSSHL
jgi:hypothetical protein